MVSFSTLKHTHVHTNKHTRLHRKKYTPLNYITSHHGVIHQVTHKKNHKSGRQWHQKKNTQKCSQRKIIIFCFIIMQDAWPRALSETMSDVSLTKCNKTPQQTSYYGDMFFFFLFIYRIVKCGWYGGDGSYK